MKVIKRNGAEQDVFFDKITTRIKILCNKNPILEHVNATLISQKVISGIFNGITTSELDNLASETAIFLATTHPDYAVLASRLVVSNLHKETCSSYEQVCEKLYNNIDCNTNLHAPLISNEFYQIVKNNINIFEQILNYDYDYNYDYFGFKTVSKLYLLKIQNKIVERPQHMILRVSIGIHKDDIPNIIKTYNLMAQKYFTHASPTLFNAGTIYPQMSSCFLQTMKSDSVEGIYDTLKNTAIISKHAGGVGLAIHDIRAKNSYIRSTQGLANGIIPMLKVFNDTARFINQSSKRKGAFAIYLEPHHADIEDFLLLKKPTGKEEFRARDLFYSLWISDLFMSRVENDQKWSLFCPDECPGLSDVYGDKYKQLYEKYEQEGKARKVINAQQLWFQIITSQIESGTPYMMYKDTINSHSNQENIGTIKCSNLCAEITEYTSPEEISVCTLASIGLPTFVENGQFNHQKLYDVCYHIVGNLNKVIDYNYYSIPETKLSNLKHRPMGIGIQGLADTFILLRYPFCSNEAKQLNTEILETMYYSAVRASCDLAKIHGPYSTFNGSPASKGILNPDMWNYTPSSRWDFSSLREDVVKYGMRNSLLISLMPTASTSSIFGFNECIEPFTSNIYSRSVIAGEFIMINKYLLQDLLKLELWNDYTKNQIIQNNGSIQNIPYIPQNIKLLYKTVWEMSMKDLIDMAADRSPYVCQSQSFNAFIETPNKVKLTSMHFYAWKKKLKTGMYYLRTKQSADAIQFSIDNKSMNEYKTNELTDTEKTCDMSDGCLVCGS